MVSPHLPPPGRLNGKIGLVVSVPGNGPRVVFMKSPGGAERESAIARYIRGTFVYTREDMIQPQRDTAAQSVGCMRNLRKQEATIIKCETELKTGKGL